MTVDDVVAFAGLLSGLALVALGAYHDQPTIMAVGLVAVVTAVVHAHENGNA